MATTPLLLIFLAGMAGSFHCIGMCGGFACALGRQLGASRRTNLLRHLSYNAGRVVTYVFLGGLAGVLGATVLTDEGTGVATGQRLLAIAAGALMIAMGAQLLGLMRRLPATTLDRWLQTVAGRLRGMLDMPGQAAALAFGVFNGFLPCPLVYAFLALAVATADPLRGMVVMMVFGLGTFPAMLLAGALGSWLRQHWRVRGVRIAGAFVMALGVVTIARGVLPLDFHGEHRSHVDVAGWERPALAQPEHLH